MDNKLVCPICGEATFLVYGKYPRKDGLCKDCSQKLFNKEIEQCEDCSKWKNTGEACTCKAPLKKDVIEEPKKEENSSELTCIICGESSNGKHFCLNCYREYKNKVVYIQVKNCKDFAKLESEYSSDLICDDGHMVKSPYEKIIDNWLYSEGIKHAYEAKLDIDETHDITPDFFIPEYNSVKNIYIEFWGYGDSNIKYQRIKEYKMSIYPELIKRDNIAVVYLCKAEVDNDSYKKKIKYAEQGKIKE